MKRTILIAALAIATAGLGCGDDEPADGNNTAANNTATNNTATNNTQANNTSLPDKFNFTFENESGDEMLADFSGSILIAGNPENLNFSISMSNTDGQMISIGIEKDQGPLELGTYSPTTFSYSYPEDARCSARTMDGEEVTITFTSADPLAGSIQGDMTCKRDTPEEFTVDISGTFSQ